MFDILIIGAGPSGLTAGIYAARANLKVGIIECDAPGGQIVNTYSIENYPGYKKVDGATLAMAMFEQCMELGVEYIGGRGTAIKKDTSPEGLFKVIVDEHEYISKALIIATGTKNKKLNVPGEGKFSGYGISWCAICDGAFYKNKNVAVIGGGNSALEESLYLAELVNKLYLIHRRDEFRADDIIIQKVKSTKNIELLTNVNVIEFIGNKNLEKIILKRKDNNQRIEVQIDGCFEYIGSEPSNDLVMSLGITNKNGYIIVDKNYETKVKGLFACGDIVDKEIRQIATAVNDGAIASLSASKYCK